MWTLVLLFLLWYSRLALAKSPIGFRRASAGFGVILTQLVSDHCRPEFAAVGSAAVGFNPPKKLSSWPFHRYSNVLLSSLCNMHTCVREV